MCFSAIVWAGYNNYVRAFDATIHIAEFERIYFPDEREKRIKRPRMPRAMDLAVARDSPRVRAFLAQEDAAAIAAIEQDMFRQGGHHIPEPVIRRRFAAGWDNFQRRYRAAVDDWALYDNAGDSPVLLEWGENP